MTKPVTALSLTLVALAVSTRAWSAEKYQYVIDATNRIVELNSQSASPSQGDLAKASALACNTLKQLLDDREFRRDLDNLKGLDEKTRGERADLKRDLALFEAAFLRPEERALIKAGLTPESVKQILWSASMLRHALDDKHDPTRILMALDKFRADVCDSAKVLEQGRDEATRRATLRTWGFRIGGIALIVSDLTFAVPTGAVSVGSVAIGTGIMAWGQ
jgi:hypothetical protein